MNCLYVSLMVAFIFVFAVSVNSSPLEGPESECPQICTFIFDPVCGHDGSCYRVYPNKCTFKTERCKNKALEEAAMGLCDEAVAKSNPDVVECKVE